MATWNAGAPDESWGASADFVPAVDDHVSDDGEMQLETDTADERPRAARIRQKDIQQSVLNTCISSPAHHLGVANHPSYFRHRLQTDRQDGSEKFISIWIRLNKNAGLVEFVPKFPRAAAAVFSEVWKKALDGSGGALIVEGNLDREALKRILDWINLCVDEGNDIKFPEVRPSQPRLEPPPS